MTGVVNVVLLSEGKQAGWGGSVSKNGMGVRRKMNWGQRLLGKRHSGCLEGTALVAGLGGRKGAALQQC